MLKIHCINVGQGDSTFIELTEEGKAFRMLIDTGHEDVKPQEGTCRQSAAEYLQNLGVNKIDLLVVTHLHDDHAEGLANVLKVAHADRFIASYIPQDGTGRAEVNPDASGSVKKQCRGLNRYCDNLATMEESGTCIEACKTDTVVYEQDGFSVTVLTANGGAVRGQHLVFDMMLANVPLPTELRDWARSLNNENSLRVELRYAGRTVCVAGDYYAVNADKEHLNRCDILKTPHHGDKKSLSEQTVSMLQPQYAVVSWSDTYQLKNDRPCKRVTDALRDAGAKVYYTDSYAEEGRPVILRNAVVFTVLEDGTVIAPEAN